MRCPKCGFISFDYNESCPKCNRNLSSERQRLNMIDFNPEPPYLLGRLLGDLNESGMHLHPAGTDSFDVLQEDIEFEAETEEVEIAAQQEHEKAEIEIELDGLSDQETLPDEELTLGAIEAETLSTERGDQSLTEESTLINSGDSLSELQLGMSRDMAEEEPIITEDSDEEPKPFVFEMEDITLEEGPSERELDLELVYDELSEAPTEVFNTDGPRENELTLEENVVSMEGVTEEVETVVQEVPIAVSKDAQETQAIEIPAPEIEQTLSLDELKDDDLGEVDVTIDDMSDLTQKIADGHGR